jgi:hypothetical protein
MPKCIAVANASRGKPRYCEGDLTLREFANEAKAREFAESLN